MSTWFPKSFSSDREYRRPCTSKSTSETTDFGCSDSDFQVSDSLASILRGCEPTGNVSGTLTVPSASQDGYQVDKFTEESSSNGSPKTESDNNTVSATRTCDHSNKKCRKQRIAVPLEKKDDKYWERRRRNNLAAKRCRESKRQMQLRDTQIADKCIQENVRLRAEIRAYRLEIATLRRILRDANTTLALWVQARQAMEPSNRLPSAVPNCACKSMTIGSNS